MLTDSDLFVCSDAPLADTADWRVPLRLLGAMREGRECVLDASVSPRLLTHLPELQDVLVGLFPDLFRRVEVRTKAATARSAAPGVSLFFSGGADSLYSLIKHRDTVDSLILIHGFDVLLRDEASFRPGSDHGSACRGHDRQAFGRGADQSA
ncbi:MAG: hypothetical protein ACRD7E_10980 [Bryobacteraceae bacterium]